MIELSIEQQLILEGGITWVEATNAFCTGLATIGGLVSLGVISTSTGQMWAIAGAAVLCTAWGIYQIVE